MSIEFKPTWHLDWTEVDQFLADKPDCYVGESSGFCLDGSRTVTIRSDRERPGAHVASFFVEMVDDDDERLSSLSAE